jgi:predicted GTPase
MAINPQEFKIFRNEMAKLGASSQDRVRGKGLGESSNLDQIYNHTRKLIEESRAPCIYLLGRSGAGKSSLVNALANKEVAKIGEFKPTTMRSKRYEISFPSRYSKWDVVDSRGLFESVAPDGKVSGDTVAMVEQDLREYQPDLILHVVTPDQVRAGESDFNIVKELKSRLGELFPPVCYCLNKVDAHGGMHAWPPEKNEHLAEKIIRNMEFLMEILNQTKARPFYEEHPLYGYQFISNRFLGVVPVHLRTQQSYWNLETLIKVIGRWFPRSAQLQFFQAQRRNYLMRQLAQDTTEKFALATADESPSVKTVTRHHLKLIGLIGAYSCRDLQKEMVEEYLQAMRASVSGVSNQTTVGREIISAPEFQSIYSIVSYRCTKAIGRSAEKYFFDGEVVPPVSYV